MEVTQEFIDKLIDHAATMAKAKRDSLGYSGEERFVPVAIFVGPHGEQAVVPVMFNGPDEKRMHYHALSKAARGEGALAIVIVNDARWAKADTFSEYFHMPRITEVGFDTWVKEYHSILDGTYGGSLRDCPREVWEEALIIAVKGPAIVPRTKLLRYRKGEGDTIEWLDSSIFEDTNDNSVGFKVNILPDWWEEPSGKPA